MAVAVAVVVVGTRLPCLRCHLLRRILYRAEQSKGRTLWVSMRLVVCDESMSEMSITNCLLYPCQKRKKETMAGDTNH